MTSIDAIIKARGGYDHLRDHPIHLENSGYMPLGIEVIGIGPRQGVMIAVHHSRVQTGDLMFDPEVVFEVFGDEWYPLSFEMSGQIYQEVMFTDETTGKRMIRPRLLKDLRRFARMWDRNIRDQGWIEVAEG